MEEFRGDILVVDDYLENANLLFDILTEHGYEVRQVISGKQAIKVVHHDPPDLILLDIMMPGMDGYEVCKHLKASPQTKNIPVIFLSALHSSMDKSKAFQFGAVDYISKPFDFDEILVRISNQITIVRQQQKITQQSQLLEKSTRNHKHCQEELKNLSQQLLSLQGELEKFKSGVSPSLKPNLVDFQGVSLTGDKPHLHSKGDILIVDDNYENLRLLFTMLNEQGYEVRQIRSGKQALITVEHEPPELILLDIRMPEIDGYEVCKRLKQNSNSYDIPVVFISAKDEVIDKVKAFKIGGVDYINKPFYLEEVLCRIETHLTIQRQKKSLQQEIKAKQKAQAELEAVNRELTRQVMLDGLTQIPNRRCFDDYLQKEWYRLQREQLPLSLIMADLDYFKDYNDTYGHLAGDDCLKTVAQTIRQILKRPADLLARYGGEELAIILPNTNLSGAEQVAENIRLEIHHLHIPHQKSKVSAYVTLSLGVASIIPSTTLSPQDLISLADQALYQAKAQGRDRVFVAFDEAVL